MGQLSGRCVAGGMAVAVCAMLVGAPSAKADVSASQACRAAIGKNLARLAKTGFKTADKCHRAADAAGQASGGCNDVSNTATFDPKGTYAKIKGKASTGIDAKCLSGDPVLDNYDGTSVEGAVYPRFEDELGSNTGILLGSLDLGGDKAKTRCLETIAKSRSAIVTEILKGATKCQAGVDKIASTFGPLDASCEAGSSFNAPKSVAKANVKIPAACTGLTGADVGSCDPLPGCVEDAAQGTGQVLARDFYHSITSPAVCGNAIVEAGEQCDGGPACNSACELTYGTCSPALPGARVVHVNITTPSALAGVQVNVSYPLFEMSIPGVGNSSSPGLVRDHVSVIPTGGDATMNDSEGTLLVLLTSVTDFIPSAPFGEPLLDVTFDRCVDLDQNICTRNPNVYGCHAVNRCTCTAAADCGPGGTPSCVLISGSTVGKQCGGGAATKVNCTSDSQCAAGQTCEPDLQGIFNPPVCAIGHFPQAGDHQPPWLVPTEIGTCDGTDLGPPGGCPSGNDCKPQDQTIFCTVSNPTDQDGNPVFGVSCSVTIDEPPPTTTTTSTSTTITTTTATTSSTTSTTDTTTTTTDTTTSTTDTTTSSTTTTT